ncbi:transcription factor UPBEAT1 [Juglans microcarpa x Juglans regia]|uniref:transcription factor UPBEAT1 n=1 Tax=Juglans microcarpa x Juglans regia TaxID=2249226 RepID=UPI001B7F477E|nr:transcription factor UPBEAT1 [Juglans microcarpa x Juglans regia]
MGVSPVQSLLIALKMEGSMPQGNEQSCSANGCLGGKVMEVQAAKRRWQGKKQRMARKYARHVLRSKRLDTARILMMKKTARLGSRKRANNGIGRRVRTLKRLIPNGESMGNLDGLFRETADYILSLQMRVRVMQTAVNVLTNFDE